MPKKFFRHKARTANRLRRANFLAPILNRPANGIFLFASGNSLGRQSDGLRKAGIPAKINQNDVERILNAVSDDRREEISFGGEINPDQNRTVDNILYYSGCTL
jgi:hypothetical protein